MTAPRPRIAVVNDVGGVAAAQTQILRAAGFDVDFIDLPKLGAGWPRWAKLLALPLRLALYLPIIRRLRTGRYDWLHVHFISQGFVGVASGRPFYIQAHGSDLHLNTRYWSMRALNRFVLRRARAIFYVTPNLRAYLADFADKAYLLPNPLAAELFHACTPPQAVRTVLIFMRLDPVKGAQDVFPHTEALARQCALTAIDWGPLARRFVPRYGQWVRFISPVPHAEIGSLLCEHDAVIGQMRQGILSLMELEGLAAGRPVLTRLDRSLYEPDPPPVVQVDDPAELPAVLSGLQERPDELARLWRSGREWIARRHSPAHHLEVLMRVYGMSDPSTASARP